MIPCLQESWRAIFSDYPLQSPSFSVSHGSLMEVDMYGINLATPEGLSERPYTCHFFIIIKSTQDWLFNIVVFPAETSASSWIVGASERDLPRAASETASSDDLSSVSPGTMLYLTETDHPDHIGLFLHAWLWFSLWFGTSTSISFTQRSSGNLSLQRQLLSLLCLYQLTTQNQSHLFLHPRHFPNQLLQRISVNIPSYILHTSKSSPPYYQSDDLMNDLRFFFAGAPSFEENDFVARLLQSTNLETRR